MAGRNNWSREETMMVFALYMAIGHKGINKTSSTVINFAKAIGRTPSSVSLKLWNFASFDPNYNADGKKGMTNAAALVKATWEKYWELGDAFLNEATSLLSKALAGYPIKFFDQESLVEYELFSCPEGKEKEAVITARVNQQYFRNTVLDNYQSRCAITGLAVQSLLIASHIKPWKDADPKTERLSASNGILLNALHDKAFDRGLLTVAPDYTIRVSRFVPKNEPESELLWRYNNQPIEMPIYASPKREFLEYHNDVIFQR